jgi:hypothetical protein
MIKPAPGNQKRVSDDIIDPDARWRRTTYERTAAWCRPNSASNRDRRSGSTRI